MAIEWTGESPELLLPLDRSSGVPLGDQLQAALREAMQDGRLRPGERLPSTRRLAADLRVSRGLVVAVYEQLVAGGYLASRPGGATRVADATPDHGGASAPASPAPATATGPAVAKPRLEIEFAFGRPDLGSFPRREWLRAMTAALAVAPDAAAGYADPQGVPELRDVLAAYLNRVRATRLRPEEVLICSGYTQGLRLVLETLAWAGHRSVAVEDPGHLGVRDVAARSGLALRPVSVDEHGLDVEELARTDARVAVLTPAHQSPTGVVLSAARRQALVAWAAECDGVIVEDDYDAEFRYDRRAVDALQGLAPAHVVTIGSVSKTLAPALRLGWLGGPPALVRDVVESKRWQDHGSPALEQFALAQLLTSGRYDRHLRRMRTHYAARREALVAALAGAAPQIRLSGLAAGFHAVAHLPAGLDELEVVAGAAARCVGLASMREHRFRLGEHPPQLVLGFGDLSPERIHRGISLIANLLRG